MMVMMSVINDYGLFRAGAMPASIAFARLCVRGDTVAAAAKLSGRLAAPGIALDLAARRQGPFRLRSRPDS